MTGFRQRLERLHIKVGSPRGTVWAQYRVSDGIKVALVGNGTREMTESLLEAEIVAAVNGVYRAYASALREISPSTGEAVVSANSRRYREALASLVADADSPRGLVRTRFRGLDSFEIRIRPQTLGRFDLSDEQLETELNAAIAAAMDQYGRKRLAAYQKAFISDHIG